MKNKKIMVLDQTMHLNKMIIFFDGYCKIQKSRSPSICYTELDAQNRYDSVYGAVGTTQQSEF